MNAGTVSKLPTSGDSPNIDDIQANASIANQDSFKFSHGLTGVGQPSNYFFVHSLAVTALIPVLLALVYRLFMANRTKEGTVLSPTVRENVINGRPTFMAVGVRLSDTSSTHQLGHVETMANYTPRAPVA